MKKGQLIARIRQVARFGKTFSAADITVNGATKETVQALLSHLKGRGELLVAQRGIRGLRPTFYFRSRTLLPVNTMQPGKWPKRVAEPPGPGEIAFKEWLFQESQRTGLSVRAVRGRFNRGKYPDLPIRRVNSRTIFVKA